ncbi:hypothetical protein HYALB_00006256 [Hymenoscyphus albidus]|uniref:Uncharacterized protein n=1 Tax=Hymenoscyphus albidus TaxID=595503 RepID=A0A9N9QDM4_9HELO|nr:hypothetical protein HYALB_00006256 [Hymenoscyphus albidus]
MTAPYDHIDIGWVERRLNEQAGVRRSRLAAYFEGVMEFQEPPPCLSRSPTPEPHEQRAWQTGAAHYPSARPSLEQRRSKGKGLPRLPSRRSTLDSDSDGIEQRQRRKRRQVTPVTRHRINFSRTFRPLLKQNQSLAKQKTTSAKMPSAHGMKTRSKSRRVGYPGISKPRPQQYKAS